MSKDSETILYSVKTNKGEYFVKQNQFGDKFFVKHIFDNIDAEIEGYRKIKDLYIVPQMISFDYESKEIVYEYIESLNTTTLHYGLFNLIDFDFLKIIEALTKNYKNIEYENENLSANAEFFIGRIPFISKYLLEENNEYKKEINYFGNKLCSFKETIQSIISELTQNRIVPMATTQGDPTDLNISIDGFVTDFEKAGKNSIVNEVAIFLGCYLTNCFYFYIKYMNSAHKIYTKTLENFKEYIEFDFNENENEIQVTKLKLLPKNVKRFILSYLESVKDLKIISNDFSIGPYVAMRMVSPVNVNTIIDKKDKVLLMVLATLFAKKYKNIEEIINFIKVV